LISPKRLDRLVDKQAFLFQLQVQQQF
jgi:hypothetical protein